MSSSEALRILIAHSFYRVRGGEDGYVAGQVKLLAERHEVKLLAESNESIHPGLRSLARMIYSPAKNKEVEAAIEEFRPDVVHLHNIYPSLGPAVHRAVAGLGIPLVMTVHNFRLRCPNGLLFTEGAPCRRCERGAYTNAITHNCFSSRAQAGAYMSALWLHRFLLGLERKVSLFVAPTEFMKGRLIEWGIPIERVRVIRHPVDTPLHASSEPGKYGIFAGRLSEEKGLTVLLRALRAAGDPPFLIVGEGPQRDEIESLSAELGLSGVRFTGWLPPERVAPLIAGSRFVAVPSVSEEAAGLTAIEAMALGRPVLASAIGALPELIAGGSGLTFRPGDSDAMATNITLLMRDDALCVRAGERGLHSASERFSVEMHRAALEEAYLRCSQDGARKRKVGPAVDAKGPVQ